MLCTLITLITLNLFIAQIGNSIRAIVVLNLQNYAGGRNPWGKPSSNTRERVHILTTFYGSESSLFI